MITDNDHRDLDLRTTPHRFRRPHAIWWALLATLAMLLVGVYAYSKLRAAITVAPKPAAENQPLSLSRAFKPGDLAAVDFGKTPGSFALSRAD
ncbi:hypothetical protein ATY81_22095 [Rhizobium sp. R72]|uniref:hypothetical protein n=1 Tax=unclassified Rhizobium TaxID=2613769 RepID=UPI000B533DAF|nr:MULTISPECIES: hypothetical protein [unclassified Rhizobium]OWW02340.1 hypothetical protein ATY81_22095 [Rhizobium sp. R72]OWW02474.1 hypothetical protein ATY80_22095 [Rhizobium sp. R711]